MSPHHGIAREGLPVTAVTRERRRQALRRTSGGLALAWASLLSLGAAAAGQWSATCFSASEIEADQALRYVTRVMVVGDTCRSPVYSRFLQRNGQSVASYRDEMARHFQRGGDSGVGFDRYVTNLANDESRAIGGQNAAVLCSGAESDFLAAADLLGPADLRRLARARAAADQTTYRRCSN
jgi:hypothetical protein